MHIVSLTAILGRILLTTKTFCALRLGEQAVVGAAVQAKGQMASAQAPVRGRETCKRFRPYLFERCAGLGKVDALNRWGVIGSVAPPPRRKPERSCVLSGRQERQH